VELYGTIKILIVTRRAEMGRVMQILAAAAIATAAVAAFAAPAGASPVPGATFVQFDLEPWPASFLTSPFGALTPLFLPTSSCAFSPSRDASGLSASVAGWRGPQLDDLLPIRQVDLHALVRGTLMDTRGYTYNVSGSFRETGLTPPFFDVPFFGSGHVTVAGPGGIVSGDAVFVDVTDPPLEWDFYFSKIQICNIR
jgi:hypothetical protein